MPVNGIHHRPFLAQHLSFRGSPTGSGSGNDHDRVFQRHSDLGSACTVQIV